MIPETRLNPIPEAGLVTAIFVTPEELHAAANQGQLSQFIDDQIEPFSSLLEPADMETLRRNVLDWIGRELVPEPALPLVYEVHLPRSAVTARK